MKTIRDAFGRDVRLTDERLSHILDHPEMAGMEADIVRTLQSPAEVRASRSDESVRLFYVFREGTLVGSKWLCVVVRYEHEDAFVITAYLTDKLKAGETLWPKK
jgi:hypothetical protein